MLTLGLWSCSSVPKKKFDEVQAATWEASALVKDYGKKSSYVLNINGQTERPDKMGLSVTTSLGIHLMTMAMQNGQVEYLIPQNKEYYFGPVSDHVLRPALGLDLHPKYLNTLVFDELPQGDDWKCERDNGFLKECFSPSRKIEVHWTRRQGDKKSVEIKGEQFQIELSLISFDPKVEFTDNSFDLNPPDSFKKFKVR